jgi:hypothetical protein
LIVGAGNDITHGNEGERIPLDLEYSRQHVPVCPGDVGFGGLCVEAGLCAQRWFIDDQPIERNIQVRPALFRGNIALYVVARDNVVMPQTRERSRPAHFDDDQRTRGIDSVYRLATRDGFLIELRGEVGRALPGRFRLTRKRRRAARNQSGNDGECRESLLHINSSCGASR